jgi:hypothetical protein
MAKIFISYRREDSSAACGRIYDRLVARYGKANIFKDVDSILPGVNFPTYVKEVIAQCTVQLVVIGRHWLEAQDAQGQRRLDSANDYVRQEIEEALKRGIVIIPVLLQGVTMPARDTLPASVQPLVDRNAVQVRDDPDFDGDIHRLISAVELWVSARPAVPLQPSTPPQVAHMAQPAPTPRRSPGVAPSVQPPPQLARVPVSLPPSSASPAYSVSPAIPAKPRTGRVGIWLGLGGLAAVIVVVSLCWGLSLLAQTNGNTSNQSGQQPTATATPGGFSDPLTSNGPGWRDDQNCSFASDGYHIKGGGWICYVPTNVPDNFTIQVQVKQISGCTCNGWGVHFRHTSTGNDYVFVIDGTGDWLVQKCINNTCSDLHALSASNGAIVSGLNALNTLEVDAKGSHFVFLANGEQLGTVDDATYASGLVGLSGGASAEVVFTNLVINEVL